MNKIIRASAVAMAAVFAVSTANNWNTKVVMADRSVEIGNQDAEVTLTEFVSYTCPHCATFAIQGEAPLQLAYVGPGKLKMEVRSVIRNVVDLTATLMTQCGAPEKFLQNHTMFMTKQNVWLDKARKSTAGQQAIWMGPDKLGGRQNMAQALGFYDMMETRGYSRPVLDRCLADEARAQKLLANTTADFAEFGIKGTPSFAINGETLENVHGWQSLYPALNQKFQGEK